MKQRPILIVDGLNVFLRHFLVNEAVSSKSEPVGGVVGFLRFLDNLIYRWSPSKLIIVWEKGGPSPKRKRLYENYKSGRGKLTKAKKSVKDDLKNDVENRVRQLSMLSGILKQTPICQLYINDTECDDIIGYLINNYFSNKQHEEVLKLVVSGDKDFYQLLHHKNVKIYDPGKKTIVDNDLVKEKFNISANNFCLARSFVGDPSDNIDGVPGVGLKTLSKRFSFLNDDEHDTTIEEVLTATRELLNTKSGSKLKSMKDILQCEDIILRNWKLMYLNITNLTPSQIEKINNTVDNFVPKMNKLGFIKEIVGNGVQISLDIDGLSRQMIQNLLFS